MTSRTARQRSVALGLTLVVLTIANLAYVRLTHWRYVLVGLVLAAVLLALARFGGLTADDIGLARARLRSGVRLGLGAGLVAAIATLVAYLAVKLVPAAARIAPDGGDGTWGQVAVTILVVLPLGTVVPEELAFRGVLPALLGGSDSDGTMLATVVSSLLFGLWHIRPALTASSANETVVNLVGAGGPAVLARVVATVVVTGVAGAVLYRLRLRSGSLLAPMLAHWSINSLGTVLAAVV